MLQGPIEKEVEKLFFRSVLFKAKNIDNKYFISDPIGCQA